MDISIPATTAPRNGEAKISTDTPIPKIPAMILKARDPLLIVLSPMPWIILDIPSNNNATAINITTNSAVATGKANAIIATISTRIPNPIVPHLDEPGKGAKIPTNIRSKPVMNKIIARIYTTEMNANAGKNNAMIASTSAIIPSPICIALIQPGDFDSENVILRKRGPVYLRFIYKVTS